MKCYKCNAIATKLCDGEVVTQKGTRDRPMCNGCANTTKEEIACVRVRGGMNSHVFSTDYCDECNANGGERKP